VLNYAIEELEHIRAELAALVSLRSRASEIEVGREQANGASGNDVAHQAAPSCRGTYLSSLSSVTSTGAPEHRRVQPVTAVDGVAAEDHRVST